MVGGNVNGAAALENNLVVPQKVEHRVSIGPRNSTPVCIPQRTENGVQTKTCPTNVHSSIIHNSQRWKQHKCPTTDEWLNKMEHNQRVEYY